MRSVGIEPRVGIAHVLGVDREPRREHVAGRLGRGPQPFERGPRPFGVHVVDRDRRDAAPVVDAGREQRREIVAEVRRRLQVHVRPGRIRRATAIDHSSSSGGHGGALCIDVPSFGQEVLDDHLLHVPVPAVRVGDRLQRVDALRARLADPDEDPRGERHARAAGRLERREPALRRLVGRAGVRAARFAEARRERLDHHSLRRAHRAQPFELGLR